MSEKLLDEETMRRLERVCLVSRKISSGRQKGERRSRHRGSSNEFADYRDYVPGDDLRFLDWKIYSRLESLFIKLFLEEEDLQVHILLDASRSMEFGTPSKWRYARQVAAALGYLCMAHMDQLTLHTFAGGLRERFGPRRGKANSSRYFAFLEALSLGEDTRLRSSFQSLAGSSRARGVAIVISDMYDFEGYEDALRKLFAADFEVLVIHVLSPEELSPSLEGDVRLVDSEIGLTTDVSMGKRVESVYARTLATFCDGIRDYVVRRGGHYLRASTALPFDDLVLDVLRRKGVLR